MRITGVKDFTQSQSVLKNTSYRNHQVCSVLSAELPKLLVRDSTQTEFGWIRTALEAIPMKCRKLKSGTDEAIK